MSWNNDKKCKFTFSILALYCGANVFKKELPGIKCIGVNWINTIRMSINWLLID